VKTGLVTKIVSLLFSLMLACTASSSFADGPTPEIILKSVIGDTLAIIKQDKGIKNGFAESNVLPQFDFALMTRSILGRNFWSQSTASQKDALIREIRTLTLNTYVAAYTSYQDFVIEYKPVNMAASDNEVTVKTLIRLPSGAESVSMDFYFHKASDGWKVFDIDLAGRSMVLARREELTPILRGGSIDAAIKLLSDLNASNVARR
jgi:phospholipid transport system substrate-binding protein